MIGKIIYTRVSTVTTKCYPGIIPQEAEPPFCSYVYDVNPTPTKSGASTVEIANVRLIILAKDYDACVTLAASIRGALDEQKGTIATYNVEQLRFAGSQYKYDEESTLHYILQNYKIRVKI
jgi:hypothetical protein